MSGDRWDEAAESPIAALTALLMLPAAIYVAFWLINWEPLTAPFSYVVAVVFCIAVPSLIGTVVGLAARATRG